ncbi:MAG: DUF4173 domain-containing protein [Gemmatimonadetes bacterium]|nr:DUF4173 domain-containing protein [Gemmatimonadota bacterium]
MTTRPAFPTRTMLTAGVVMGLAGDQLLRVPDGPGLNFFLLLAGLALSVWAVARSTGRQLSRESSLWLGLGVVCGAALLWRGSGMIRFWTFVAACGAFALPTLHAGRAWVTRAGVLDVAAAAVGTCLHTAFGAVRLIIGLRSEEREATDSRGPARSAFRTAVVGTLLAAVPLFVFGALFVSADAVFARILGDLVRFDLETVASHLFAVAALGWLTCGYLTGMVVGTDLRGDRDFRGALPRLGTAEVATAMGLVDLLFLAFVAVQLRYLFGGASLVQVTPDLTYAEYAREGFFQLVAAVALAIPWMLGTHALLEDRGLKARSWFAGLAGTQLALLLVVVASAVQRMLAYQGAYGLTELRVVATTGLVALTALLLWFGATVLSGRAHRFSFGVLVTGYLLVAALQIMNPAGLVVRHNLDRSVALGGVDVEYLASLGSDATPGLVARIAELDGDEQCLVAERLLRSWGPDRPGDWRSFNLSESRARSAVRAEESRLRSLVATGLCEAARP